MSGKTHWKKLHNPDYLGAYSIDNETLIVQIQSVAKELITGAEGKKEEAIVAKLVGQKPMILNATNCKTIAGLYGNYIEDWKGKYIELYVSNVRAFGTTVEALRIKDRVPKAGLPELTPNHPNWAKAKASIDQGFTIEQIRQKYQISEENATLLCSKSDVQA